MMKKAILTPQISVGNIRFGDNIENYPDRKFEYSDVVGGEPYGCYSFAETPVFAYTVNTGEIESVLCRDECVWQGMNLIGMNFNEFRKIYIKEPEDVETLPVMTDAGDQEQICYGFDELGLQIWVLGSKIDSVVATSYSD